MKSKCLILRTEDLCGRLTLEQNQSAGILLYQQRNCIVSLNVLWGMCVCIQQTFGQGNHPMTHQISVPKRKTGNAHISGQ